MKNIEKNHLFKNLSVVMKSFKINFLFWMISVICIISITEFSDDKSYANSFITYILAMLLGWYFLDEHLNIPMILSAIMILTGVYFINSQKADGVGTGEKQQR